MNRWTVPQVFGDFSTAISAPGATYYVDKSTGSDSNNGLTAGAAFKSINKLITVANAGGVPAKGYIKGYGDLTIYERAYNPGGSAGTVTPSVEIAFMAYGGDVVSTTSEDTFAPTADGTQTNTYSQAISNAQQVVDWGVPPDQFGHKPRLVNVGSAAIANRLPNAWVIAAGTAYFNRVDGAQPTTSNTRLYRDTLNNAFLGNPVNVYFGSEDGSRWIFEGGGNTASTGGCAYIANSSAAAVKLVMFDNCVFRYGVRGIAANGWNGYIVANRCDVGATMDDAYNIHSPNTGQDCTLVLINCSGAVAGLKGRTSVNMLTAHETAGLVVIGGHYRLSAGGMMRSINNSINFAAGVILDTDRGDYWIVVGPSPRR